MCFKIFGGFLSLKLPFDSHSFFLLIETNVSRLMILWACTIFGILVMIDGTIGRAYVLIKESTIFKTTNFGHQNESHQNYVELITHNV